MMRWLRSLFAWRIVRDTGVWIYWQNDVTGRRQVTRANVGGHQPVDTDWVETGKWHRPKPPRPIDIGGPSCGQPPRVRRVVMRPAGGDCDCEPGRVCRAPICPRFVSHIRAPQAQSQHQPRGR